MSAPLSTRTADGQAPSPSATPPRSTRQILDELDALMAKMLTIPVVETNDDNASSIEVAQPPSPVAVPISEQKPQSKSPPPVAATLTMIDATASESSDTETPWTAGLFEIRRAGVEPTVSVGPQPIPEPTTEVDVIEVGDAEVLEPELEPEPEPEPVVVTKPSHPAMVPVHVAARRNLGGSRPMPASTASWSQRFLVVWDRGFRRRTRALGPVGWVLRSWPGRWLIGLASIALWGAAIGWLGRDLWVYWTG